MIISLSGKPGSGKSTVAKKLATVLGYDRYYIGGMRREMARRKGMTLAEYNKWGEKSNRTDKEFDEYVKKLGQTKDNFIIEGRTAFHFIPNSIKIFLDIDPETGAKRIWQAIKRNSQPNRNEDKCLKSYENVLVSIKDRVKSDIYRYSKFYGLNILDKKNYDLFLDTADLDADQEFERVYAFVKEKLKKDEKI